MARPKTNKPKENMLYIKVDAEMKERIQSEADSQAISMSAWIRQALVKAMKSQKKEWPPEYGEYSESLVTA